MLSKIIFRGSAIVVCLSLTTLSINAEETNTSEVVRVSKKVDPRTGKPHPLDPALTLAERGLEKMDTNIKDYTATLIRRERVNGRLTQAEYSNIKIRNEYVDESGKKHPFSIYMTFTKPAAVKGREVIWIKGRNDDKICVHDGSALFKHLTLNLDPDGMMAMKGNRYPIYEAGLRNLIVKLLEKGNRDKQHGECEVKFFRNAKINGRTCTVMQVLHPVQRDYFEFYKAQIFIDDEYQIPVRYASWSWPQKKGEKPLLEEEYTYVNVKLNVGLTDVDFDSKNPKYNYKK